MRLHCWNRAKKDVEFEPSTGSARFIKLKSLRPQSEKPLGFAQLERPLLRPRVAFALFRSGDSVFFGAGAKHWRLGEPGLRFAHTRTLPFVSRFDVYENDRVVFSIRYTHVVRWLMSLADPTYDLLEEDTDYFLSFVAQYAGSAGWRGNVLRQWRRGPEISYHTARFHKEDSDRG